MKRTINYEAVYRPPTPIHRITAEASIWLEQQEPRIPDKIKVQALFKLEITSFDDRYSSGEMDVSMVLSYEDGA